MKKILFLPEPRSILSTQLGVMLEAEGFCVDHSQVDSEKWMLDVENVQPDLVLLEIMADNYRERYKFCHKLRQESQTENIPVLLLGASKENGNGKISPYYLLEGLHAGANDYLQGPYDISELIGKINTALRLKASLERAHVLTEQLNQVNEELYQRNIQVEKELHIARQLQQSLLPHPLPVPDEETDYGPMFTKIHYQDSKIRISGIYLPCDALGGDLYDMIKFKDNSLGISITDVSGHGVPAGFITAIFKTSLYRLTQQIIAPAEVMFHINNELYDIVKTGDYVTAVYMRLDLETMKLDCAGAGHPYPVYYSAAEKKIHRLKQNGLPLVWAKNTEYPTDSIRLFPGDKVFMFTDGVSELKNSSGEMYSEKRVEDQLIEAIELEVPYLTDHLIGNLSDYTEGTPLEDDISMVLIESLLYQFP